MSKSKPLTVGKVIGRIILLLLTTILAIACALAIAVATIIKGPSIAARNTFVTTVLESGNLKWTASLFLSEEEIQEILETTSMGEVDEDTDPDLFDEDSEDIQGNFDENGIEVVKINGTNYAATLLIIKDPSKVMVGTTYPFGEYGKDLDQIVKSYGAVAGVNGGLYAADLNKGGSPFGVCVSKGQIQYNKPYEYSNLYMIGLDNNNILRITNIKGWTSEQFQQYVQDEGIRDAVAFQDQITADTNHFVPLIINGEERALEGNGTGSNPRTAIGQRADKAILLLVTDGRGKSGHLGATAQDLIEIMKEYGAVNAANLDGGSSATMYYKDEYLMPSVTLYYANKSWRLPTAFIVMGGDN